MEVVGKVRPTWLIVFSPDWLPILLILTRRKSGWVCAFKPVGVPLSEKGMWPWSDAFGTDVRYLFMVRSGRFCQQMTRVHEVEWGPIESSNKSDFLYHSGKCWKRFRFVFSFHYWLYGKQKCRIWWIELCEVKKPGKHAMCQLSTFLSALEGGCSCNCK